MSQKKKKKKNLFFFFLPHTPRIRKLEAEKWSNFRKVRLDVFYQSVSEYKCKLSKLLRNHVWCSIFSECEGQLTPAALQNTALKSTAEVASTGDFCLPREGLRFKSMS